MNIENTSGTRRRAAISLFVKKKCAIQYKNRLISFTPRNVITIDSYCPTEPHSASEKNALASIEQSKKILRELSIKYKDIAAVVSQHKVEFAYCYDYGKGAFALAMEKNEKFTWLYKQPST